MRNILSPLAGMAVLAAILSCSEERIGSNPDGMVHGITVTGTDFVYGDDTRAAYTVDNSGFHFTWTAGDTVGIYPVGADQVAFPISSGDGSQTAQFDGGAWALRADRQYAAYYPFDVWNYLGNSNSIPVSYIGQTQSGNASTAHLDRYDYMASAAVKPDLSGCVNITMKHLGSFVRFQLTMPQADTYSRLTLTDSGSGFVTTGTYDLSSQTPAIKSVGTSKTISMDLKNVSTTSAGQTITLYMMLAPGNLSSHKLALSLSGKTGITYKAELEGKDLQPGKAYSYSPAITSGTNINGEDVSWADDDPSQPTHEYVDLGLSVMWATCNIGASTPEKIGNRFAWGEIEPDKKYYDWDNYKWYGTSVNKYTSSDGMYKLESDDDAAIRLWGGNWRMPTEDELYELYSKCNWKSENLNGVSGYRVTGPNGNSIFIPCNGQYDESGLQWKSTVMLWSNERASSSSYAISLHSGSGGVSDFNHRHDGLCIRPVYDPSQQTHEFFNSDIVNITISDIFLKTLKPDVTGNTAFSLVIDEFVKIKDNTGKDLFSYTSGAWAATPYAISTYGLTGSETVDVIFNKFVYSKNDTEASFCGNLFAVGHEIHWDNRGTDLQVDKHATANITVAINNNAFKQDVDAKIIVLSTAHSYHEYVDLGLSVKWATCNVGATKPEEYGDYFAWGETEPYYNGDSQNPTGWKSGKSSGYYWPSYKYCKGNYNTMTKYCNKSSYGYNGYTDSKTVLDPEDDAAHVNWGGSWRMPTRAEQDELRTNCTWTWTTINGIKGYKVQSKKSGYTDRWIFLPAAGYRGGTNLGDVGSRGYYWSSSLYTDGPNCAYCLYFNSDYMGWFNDDRGGGPSVRPVCQ